MTHNVKCKRKTLTGRVCKRRAKNNYCWQHISFECNVCYEEKNYKNFYMLDCCQNINKLCLLCFNNPNLYRCPYCRTPIKPQPEEDSNVQVIYHFKLHRDDVNKIIEKLEEYDGVITLDTLFITVDENGTGIIPMMVEFDTHYGIFREFLFVMLLMNIFINFNHFQLLDANIFFS